MTDNVVFTHAGGTLPFPPLTKSHILNCSYHSWHPRYRTITPKARLIPLPQPCLDYLRADGIVLPPDDDDPQHAWSDSDSGVFSSADNASQSDDEDDDPSAEWRETHESIKSTITELGGKVIPKLNWSAPKDATWIAATNSMECCNPNDIYLLLKSSDFVTHDLEHAFDECVGDESMAVASIPYHLILRKHFQLNPSLEFRCFVRHRKLIALCQRDLNHFDFLFKLQDHLGKQIQLFFDLRLRDTFPDENFVFDVYVPPPHNKVWLVDINPWARRTDPLLFSWMELLSMPEPRDLPDIKHPQTPNTAPASVAAQSNNLKQEQDSAPRFQTRRSPLSQCMSTSDFEEREEEGENSEDDVEDIFVPEFRLVRRDDPEAYGFTTPQYSAHKLPRDVVDASRGGESEMREFAEQWKELVHKMEHQANLGEGDDSEEE